MDIATKETKTIMEFRQEHIHMLDKVIATYTAHKESCKNWSMGIPVKCWESDDCDICVQYEDGSQFHYKGLGLQLPFQQKMILNGTKKRVRR